MTVSRRTILASVTALVGSFAGCAANVSQSSPTDSQQPPPLHTIEIKNSFENKQSIELVVKRNSSVVEWTSYEIPPANADSEENYLGRAVELEQPWMGCGTYEICARVSNTGLWTTLDFQDLEPSQSLDEKYQAVILRIEFSPETINMRTIRLDDPLYNCKSTTTSTTS